MASNVVPSILHHPLLQPLSLLSALRRGRWKISICRSCRRFVKRLNRVTSRSAPRPSAWNWPLVRSFRPAKVSVFGCTAKITSGIRPSTGFFAIAFAWWTGPVNLGEWSPAAARGVRTITSADEVKRFLRPPRSAGFYRYDIEIVDFNGRLLAEYGKYIRVERKFWDARLGLNGHKFKPGGQVLSRVENFGTEPIAHGEEFGIQAYQGGSWVRSEPIPRNLALLAGIRRRGFVRPVQRSSTPTRLPGRPVPDREGSRAVALAQGHAVLSPDCAF